MNGLWCKRCLWHKCRCGINHVSMPSLASIKRELQYTRTMEMVEVKTGMTIDDLRRNVIEDLKERD